VDALGELLPRSRAGYPALLHVCHRVTRGIGRPQAWRFCLKPARFVAIMPGLAPGVQDELLALVAAPAFSDALSAAMQVAFERYEADTGPEYLPDLAARFNNVLTQTLGRAASTDERRRFLRTFVRDGLAAGSDPNMLVRRSTLLVTLVASELTAGLEAHSRREGARWLAGFASGYVCDLLFELNAATPGPTSLA
jgi:hypothetical protein